MNNHLANPFLILKEKCQQAWSGCLEIAEPEDNSIGWQIYFFQGKIQYATSTVGNQERLNYLWQQFQLGSDCPQVAATKEYEAICQWCDRAATKTELNLTEILLKLNQEAFAQIFSLEQTIIKSIDNHCLSTNAINFSAKDLLDRQLIDSGKEVRKYFKSPFVRLELKKDNSFKFYKLWKELCKETEFNNFANNHKLSSIIDYCSQNLIFYQFATSLNLDILSVAKCFQAFIESQIIELKPFNESKTTVKTIDNRPVTLPEINLNTSQKSINSSIQELNNLVDDSRPVIACIDDSKTVHKQVNLTLEAVGYRVINISDPTLALKALSREQPILILMDINMPTMNGYDLCSMLRRSNKFSEIPIIMLTGRDGIIDRMKAKFVGSTDYSTKPFQPNALIEMVQKFVPSTLSI